ncbi:MAG: hypothetical protein LLG37_02840 [Spirochaetia bacterium]|nr:hypothetical protein [Spirochaetia bacterium]
MKYDVLLYQSGLIVLMAAVIWNAVVIFKLSAVIKQNKPIWILPAFAAVLLAAAFCFHAYASYSLLPQMTELINRMASSDVMLDPARLGTLKIQMAQVKDALIWLKMASFTAFGVAALMLLMSNLIYLKWISK